MNREIRRGMVGDRRLRQKMKADGAVLADPEVEVVLAAFAEYSGVEVWKIRACWNTTPEYLKPRTLRQLKEAVEELKNGLIEKK